MDLADKIIYMDNGASTKMDERVHDAMKPFFFDTYAVATSDFGYSMGTDAKDALMKFRETIAESINAMPEEIIFTSGYTESSNMAIKGLLAKSEKKHIITSSIEDFSVLNTIKALEKEGYTVTYLKVNEYGLINPNDLETAINNDTALISIQSANQEIGTLQDIEALGSIARKHSIPFHTDAVHAYMRAPIDVKAMNIDMMSIDAYTIHGPRGVGALYMKKGIKAAKYMDGGYQENNRRAGPENMPGIAGFAKAVQLIDQSENERLKHMRDYLTERIIESIEDVTVNGHSTKRVPQNANITFHYVEGESITLHLDMRGIAVSTGSACFSRSLEASHVILGIGGDHERAHGSVRFTLGRFNTKEEIDAVVEALKDIIETLRAISPLKKNGGTQ